MTDINKNKAFLEPSLCKKIARQAVELKPNLRVELTLRGEPTLNPNLLENLRILREEAPMFQISLFTNGIRFLKGHLSMEDCLDAGVNILCVDCYNNTYPRFLKLAESSGDTVVDFRDFSAYRRHPKGHKMRVINLVPDIKKGEVQVRKIRNNAGSVSPAYLASLPNRKSLKLPLQKGCSRSFTELVVHHNGDVPICCSDWKSEHILGNINDQSLEEIWYGRNHWNVLCKLHCKHHDRGSLTPCDKCDYNGGYRLGLLQDPTKSPT